MEDWDLQAIVKGCSSRQNSRLMEDYPNFYSNFWSEEDEFSCVNYYYPQLFETTTTTNNNNNNNPGTSSSSSHEFEGFGNSSMIYPILHPLNAHPNNNDSASISELLAEFKEPEKLHHHKKNNQITPTKQKQSKKSRQNRVVKEVKADSVCSDSWGWRKYGQKPIKGSPYPRSYYRCSSSKGCSARKQVERSLSDPDVFLVTYTAEHNHAEPTRRNALAGTTRKKFPAENPSFDMMPLSSSPNNSVASIEEEQAMEGEVLMKNNNMPFEFSTEDLFSGLEDYLLFG